MLFKVVRGTKAFKCEKSHYKSLPRNSSFFPHQRVRRHFCVERGRRPVHPCYLPFKKCPHVAIFRLERKVTFEIYRLLKDETLRSCHPGPTYLYFLMQAWPDYSCLFPEVKHPWIPRMPIKQGAFYDNKQMASSLHWLCCPTWDYFLPSPDVLRYEMADKP